MKNTIRILGIIIIAFGAFFYIMPFINQVKSVVISLKYFDVGVTLDLFNSILYTICGIGIFKLRKNARKIWLVYSGCIIFINLPFAVAFIQELIQELIKGQHIITTFPFYYWIKVYGSLLLLVYSIIFLNLPKTKSFFKRKDGTT